MTAPTVDAPGRAPEPWPSGPRRRAVAARQLLLVPRARTGFLVLLLLLPVGLALAPGYMIRASGGRPGMIVEAATVLLAAYPLILVLAVPWAGQVWRNEGPRRRRYHWLMPVPRPAHQLCRTVSGAVWLLAAAGLGSLVASLLLAAMTGAPWRPGPAATWIGLTGGILAAYLAGGAASLVVERPVAVVWGGLGGLWMLRVFLETGGAGRFPRLDRWIDALLAGEWGFVTALRVPADPAILEAAGWGPLLLWLALLSAAAAAAALVHLEGAPRRGG